MVLKCRLCETSTDFGKSHVIPESFFLHKKIEGDTLLAISNAPGHYPKRRPIGEYDSQILCKECEKVFGPWDDYAKTLLLDKSSDFQKKVNGNAVTGFQIEPYDYEKLKMFSISVLWRASVSEREVFNKVSLGPHESKLREMIRSSDPGRKDDYAVYFYRFSGASCAGPMFMPDRCKNPYGLRYYRIYLGDYYFDIKVDKRPTPKEILSRVICDKEPLYIHCVNLKGSPELEILRKMVDSPNNKNI